MGLTAEIRKRAVMTVFSVKKAVARAGFKYRRGRYFRKRYPTVWLSPARLLEMDLEHYEAVSDEHTLSVTMLEKLRSYRDAIDEKARRIKQINLLMFVALVANYFSIENDLSFAFGIKAKFAGFREVFLVALSFFGMYILILENNTYTLNSYMKFIIRRLPEEVRQMHYTSHFFMENMSRYIPINLPRIAQTPLNSNISMIPLLFGLFVLLAAVVVYGGMYFLIARDIWQNGNVEFWSKVSVAVALVNFVFGAIYLVTSRVPLPYRDYSNLDDIEFIKAFAPSQLQKVYDKIYADENADYYQMMEKGYIDSNEDPYAKL